MHTPRLELTGNAQARLGLTSAFAHFTFLTHGDSGFDVVRQWLRRRQGEQHKLGFLPSTAIKAIGDVAALGYWKTFHRRLWFPRDADLLLQVDIEQMPNWDSHLSLTNGRDDLGRKRLIIDWSIRTEDIEVIRKVVHRISRAWERSSLKHFARMEPIPLERFDDFASLHDVYHPTGSLRMGVGPGSSVVDQDLRLWAIDNCYISSTAVFPSSGSANPGLTHLALTARLAGHLAQRLR
jgi:choline dehydrogenase-like flavoprotein